VSKPPLLSLDERRAALAKAAQSRKIRAGFKNEIKNGKRDWRDAFSSSDEVLVRPEFTTSWNVAEFHRPGGFKV